MKTNHAYTKTLIILAIISTCSCSKVINTVGGLTTFQSTISGSNYPFLVNEQGKLGVVNSVKPEKLIQLNENFEITLDTGFIRYLQASDPYVLIYSKAWIGDNPPPTDEASYRKQIVLVKEGTAFNARLPISNIPLFGPVTLDTLNDVHLSLYVVVLSKQDNQETTNLLDGAASTVSTFAPQYAVIAGAAAAIGDAIIAQNKDKIEFEHSYKFSAYKNNTEINFAVSPHNSTVALAEARHVIIKGENENRLIPYDNWFFYLSPFNWLGHKPSINSTRFEMKKGLFDLPYEDSNLTIVNAPFRLLHQLVLPNESLLGRANRVGLKNWMKIKESTEIPPGKITACGGYLLSDIVSNIADCKNLSPENLNFSETLYTDKTYMIILLKRSDSTIGKYNETKELFVDQAKAIGDLVNTTDSVAAVTTAFETVRSQFLIKNMKKNLVDRAKDNPLLNKEVEELVSPENKDIKDAEKLVVNQFYIVGYRDFNFTLAS